MTGRIEGFVNMFNKSMTNLLIRWQELQKWGLFKKEGQAPGSSNEEHQVHIIISRFTDKKIVGEQSSTWEVSEERES